MPVTIQPDPVALASINDIHPLSTKKYSRFDTPVDLLLETATSGIRPGCGEIFQSSFSTHASSLSPEDRFASTNLSTTYVMKTSFNNGFIGTALTAYNGHHALILRPEDIWIAILTQFNLFVNARAEQLRHLFVAHDGKKELEVTAIGNRYTVDFGNMAKQMTEKIQENVIDAELREWIMPNFSTTTNTDRVVCAVAMMSTLQQYFEYLMTTMCGVPSVTLLGQRSDWQAIHEKVDKLNDYGEETKEWVSLLKPVLARFVKTFDDPKSKDVKNFWQTMIKSHNGGSGSPELSGWITAFCFFNKDGKRIGRSSGGFAARRATSLKLDGVSYLFVDHSDVPASVVNVPVKLDDNGMKFDTLMVAGLVGAKVSDSASDRNGEKDTLQPVAGWWMCENTGATAQVTQAERNGFPVDKFYDEFLAALGE